MGALSHKTFSTNSSNPEGVVMSYLERLFKEMGKGPVHLVFGVAVNKRYRTVFGMEKIDQGRHEGALTTTTFSPHRHDNSFLIIGFVTHFLALFA